MTQDMLLTEEKLRCRLGELYPYKNAIPYLKEIADKTQSKVMSLLMHWEGTAPWAPPYMWSPYGGEQQFEEYKKELHELDMLLGLYCSGMGWTQLFLLQQGAWTHTVTREMAGQRDEENIR